MGYNDEIEVEYDTTDVPRPESGGSLYSTKLSGYFYNKINSIDNEEDDFSSEEISQYQLEENNGKINISTTSKLIRYLKSLIKVNIERLDSKVDNKLNKSEYVIDNELKNSQNPLSNNVIYNKFNEIMSALANKSNISHTHNINEISSLSTNIDLKANKTDLNNHTSNKNNPHGVTKSQIGLGNVSNVSIYTGSFSKSVGANDYEYIDVSIPIEKWGRVYISCNNNTIYRDARLATNNTTNGEFQIYCYNGTKTKVTISGYWLYIG